METNEEMNTNEVDQELEEFKRISLSEGLINGSIPLNKRSDLNTNIASGEDEQTQRKFYEALASAFNNYSSYADITINDISEFTTVPDGGEPLNETVFQLILDNQSICSINNIVSLSTTDDSFNKEDTLFLYSFNLPGEKENALYICKKDKNEEYTIYTINQ